MEQSRSYEASYWISTMTRNTRRLTSSLIYELLFHPLYVKLAQKQVGALSMIER